MKKRPRRRMPSLTAIMQHHQLGHVPYCVRCGFVTQHVEKAHIIDRFVGGLDTPANLAPLCSGCHKGQPMYQSGDEERALRWFGLPPLDSVPLPPGMLGRVAHALQDIVPAGEATLQAYWGHSYDPTKPGLPEHPLKELSKYLTQYERAHRRMRAEDKAWAREQAASPAG